jgi:hypothetical protein
MLLKGGARGDAHKPIVLLLFEALCKRIIVFNSVSQLVLGINNWMNNL